jgi:aspartate racemase
MRKIGLVGGISWISTVDYYTHINKGVNSRLGGMEFAECIIYSVNYGPIQKNNAANDWDATFVIVHQACTHLISAGAEAILLCANTMHLIADRLQAKLPVPIIHIAEVTATAIRNQGVAKVALLGTRFTMEKDFFKDKLAALGIEAIVPNETDRIFIHQTINEELGKGLLTAETKARYLAISKQLINQGAQGVILGCTEIPLVIKPGELPVPIFDTALIHSEAAVNFMLQKS